jgi:hypothetical protein
VPKKGRKATVRFSAKVESDPWGVKPVFITLKNRISSLININDAAETSLYCDYFFFDSILAFLRSTEVRNGNIPYIFPVNLFLELMLEARDENSITIKDKFAISTNSSSQNTYSDSGFPTLDAPEMKEYRTQEQTTKNHDWKTKSMRVGIKPSFAHSALALSNALIVISGVAFRRYNDS